MKAGILVLDFGTTELKAVLYDEAFEAVDTCSRAWTYRYPRPLHIEHPAPGYWTAALEAMQYLLRDEARRRVLAAISVTGQAETLIGLDRAGAPIGEAIVWLDTRAQDESRTLAGFIDGDTLYRRTGNTGFDPVMPVCKLPWLKRHATDQYNATAKFLLLKEYIIFCLTGEMAGECSALSCSGYFDITRRALDADILRAAGIDPALLPAPAESLAVIGPVAPPVARLLGIGPGIPVVNGMLDQCASAIGAGNVRPGVISETTGTVLAIAATLEDFPPPAATERVLTLCHALPGRYLALPNCPTAGVLLNWFAEQCLSEPEWAADGSPFACMDRLAAAKPPDADGLLCLPHFSGRLSPVHAPNARGVLYGLTLGTNKGDIARALLQSVGFLLRENLDLLARQGVQSAEILSLGGAARSAVWTQMKADICHKPFVTLKNSQSTALGCAVGAGLATGLLPSLGSLTHLVRKAACFAPDAAQGAAYDALYDRYLKLNDALGFTPGSTQKEAQQA